MRLFSIDIFSFEFLISCLIKEDLFSNDMSILVLFFIFLTISFYEFDCNDSFKDYTEDESDSSSFIYAYIYSFRFTEV